MKFKIAQELLNVGAVSLSPTEPYTWASGIKSPIYCDNRLLLSYPKVRDMIVSGFVDMIQTDYPQTEMIMGTATAGIPWAALVADRMNLAMGYVRSEAKSHGKTNAIEGCIHDGINVVVIEDLISTAQSVEKVVEALRDKKCNVLAVGAIFTYQMESARTCFDRIGCPLHTLSDYESLIQLALDTNYVSMLEFEKLKKFREQPHNDNWMLIL